MLAEVRGPLEEQVAAARRSLLDTTRGARSAVQGQVDRWIGVEKAVESGYMVCMHAERWTTKLTFTSSDRVSSLIPDDEPITPGMLYVGIATLAGSVFTRYRSLPIRLVAPPLLFVGSLNYFLPSTAYNVGQYYLELEQRHLPPVVREQRQNVLQSWHNVRRSTGQQLAKAREGTGDLLQRGLQGVEQNTGLKVGGGGNGKASSNAEPRSRLV